MDESVTVSCDAPPPETSVSVDFIRSRLMQQAGVLAEGLWPL